MGLPLLIMTCVGQAWAADRTINPSRLQEQIERQAEQASKTLPASPRTDMHWLDEVPRDQTMVEKYEAEKASGRGYGRGYEMRYGSPNTTAPTGGLSASPAGGGVGAGGVSAGSGGRGRR
ncbi:MAG: hypothetical protein AB1344_09350 [Pseudomonadota bacterium]